MATDEPSLEVHFRARGVPLYLGRWYSDTVEANGGRELVGTRHLLLAYALATERETISRKALGDLVLEAVLRLDGENARNRLLTWIERNHRMREFGLIGIWFRTPKENGHGKPNPTGDAEPTS